WGSPLPIPNREVKPTSADGTWSKAWESMSMPILQKTLIMKIVRVFCFKEILNRVETGDFLLLLFFFLDEKVTAWAYFLS
ncbi:MAG: hypothetical protein K0R26_2825, partial [Bacteroidota bacterium]|nr:hypothetical protein [Bacteroidota bacterium]